MRPLMRNLPGILVIAIVIGIGVFIVYKFVVTPIEKRTKARQEFNVEGKSFSVGEKVRLKYYPEIVGVVVYVNTMTDVYTIGLVDNNNHYYEETFYPRHLTKFGNANN